jgi:ABC-type molybdate transport system substrate-binding protein
MLRHFIISAIAIGLSLLLIGVSRHRPRVVMTVLCAPSLSGPMEELKRSFNQLSQDDGGFIVEITYRGSAELLSLYQISGSGDLLVAADAVYHQPFVEEKLVDSPILVGQQLPCLIYTDLPRNRALSILSNPSSAKSSPGHSSPNLTTTSIPKSEHAAIGRQVKKILGQNQYQRLLSNAKVTRETVSQVAADVSNKIVQLGIAWNTTAKQFPNLKTIVPPDWQKHPSNVGASVFINSPRRRPAERFRKFLASPHGSATFERYGFTNPDSVTFVGTGSPPTQ